MIEYVKIADIIKPCKIGNTELDIMDYTNKKLGFWETMSLICHEKYARLVCDGEVMMTETPMEHRTNRYFINNAHGDILIGGLGIGMIILPIQDNPKITSITVIEKSAEVISVVVSQLPFNEKIKIINDDVFKFKPNRKYDCIYMDIWAYINSDVYQEQMKPLKRKYCHYLKSKEESPDRFVYCWCEYEAKNNRRLI